MLDTGAGFEGDPNAAGGPTLSGALLPVVKNPLVPTVVPFGW